MYPNRLTRSAQGPRRRSLSGPLAAVVAIVLLAANPGLVFAWNSLSFSSTEEARMITMTNQARASNGLAALLEDATLRSVAEQRAKYIYDNNWAQHTQLDGKTAFTILKGMGYCYLAAAENLGTNNYSDSTATQTMFDWFMSSSAHRANILGPYTHIGIGAYKGSDPSSSMYHVYVMIFSKPCSSATPRPKATPRPVKAATPVVTPEPTPGPTSDPGAIGADSGLAVVDEVPSLNLLDTIVGGVVSAYFGH
ncbi:MAG TPA: CAP domain-containing protein [Candidatus Limnocylindrales bacterium]|nr:CAP domain-containing protein [Candidatus Limnocylindrales bacterium]